MGAAGIGVGMSVGGGIAVGGGAVGRISVVVVGAAVPQADRTSSNRLHTVRSGHDLVHFMLSSVMLWKGWGRGAGIPVLDCGDAYPMNAVLGTLKVG